MKKILHFIDNHLLSILTIVFLILVPLYPKFPFIRINDTYISVRLEDFFVACMTVLFAVQAFRKKVQWDNKFVRLFAFFWGAVIVSFLFNFFIAKTIQFRNIGVLHTLRRIEYMIPFFVAYAAVRIELSQSSKLPEKVMNKFLSVAIWVVLIVCIYATGQRSATAFQPLRDNLEWIANNNTGVLHAFYYFLFRFFDFPAVQTMNAEFAKGYLLNLTPFSRISSTFAGHYDLAAYLVFFIPIVAGLIIQGKNVIRDCATYVLSILTLVLTASRISFGAFVGSIIVFLVYKRKWKGLILTVLLTTFLMYLNKDMTDRFKDMFQSRRVFENVQTGAVIINQDIQTDVLPAGSEFVTQSATTAVMTDKDKIDLKKHLVQKELDDARKGGKSLSQDEAMRIVEKKYQELQSFVVKDVVAGDTSLATRTQVEWPRALNAFFKNPILGTGPSSITESTDGDYFRWLGETGLLGTIPFVGVLLLVWFRNLKVGRQKHGENAIIHLAFCAGMIALGMNAVFIDVFEASKVAFIFWTMSGIFVAMTTVRAPTTGKT